MFTRPRGTRDFLPEEMKRRRWAELAMRGALESFGFEEIMTPTFEHAELFTERSGEDIVEQLYVFEDKGGRRLALRPELTAPTMRLFSESLSRRPQPVRIYYFENCFRYERPQKGRFREFWQMGAETIGRRTPLRTLDTIMAAYTAIRATGLENLPLKVNNITLIRRLLGLLKVDSETEGEMLRALDRGDTEAFENALSTADPRAAALYRDFVTSPTEKALSSILEQQGVEGGIREELLRMYGNLQRMVETLRALGAQSASISPGVVRGLDYYDGVVFEIEDPRLGAEKQICGGGEYVFKFLGKEPLEGVGFAIGFDRLLLSLTERGIKGTSEREKVLLTVLDEGIEAYALEASLRIREAGVSVEVLEVKGGLRKALTTALKRGYGKVVVIGRREAERGVVLIRDLKGRSQEILTLSELKEVFTAPSRR